MSDLARLSCNVQQPGREFPCRAVEICPKFPANRGVAGKSPFQRRRAPSPTIELARAPAYRPDMTEAAIVIDQLCKTYAGGKRALDDVSFEVPRGSVFGLLGPNGAGKSTLINILAGLVNKTSGNATIWGFDIDAHPRNAKASIGIVNQEILFDPFFTPFETLEIQAGLYGVPRAKRHTMELLRAVHLEDKANAYARTLSGGMKRRLMVAKAMVHRPPVLVLDEPTAGVDIELRQQLWAYVRSLNEQGVTVVLTTHYLEEAEQLCDRIAIINHGTVIANKPTRELVGMAQEKLVEVTVDRDVATLPANGCFQKIALKGERVLEITYRKDQANAGQVLAAVQAGGFGIVEVTTKEPDLEDVFLNLTRAANA
jgi:ABC-2 type transport system ATP-binding protein